MYYYPYEQFITDVKSLVQQSKAYDPDTLIAVARGGVTLGHAYASATNNRRLMSINSILYEGQARGNSCEIFNTPELKEAKKVLILDDIIDSGQTLKEVVAHLKSCYPHVTFKLASIYYKKSAVIRPDFVVHEATDWIEFFWEKDFLA